MRIQNEETALIWRRFFFVRHFGGEAPQRPGTFQIFPEIRDFPYIQGILSIPASRSLPVIEKNSQFL